MRFLTATAATTLACIASCASLVSSAPAATGEAGPSPPLSSPHPSGLRNLFSPAIPYPVVIWHGLGDSSFSPGLLELKSSLQEAFPGIYVHLVSLGSDEASDRNRGVFGEVNQDVETACQEIGSLQELKGGFDALGFSQGGQFLRALVQRCPQAKVRNLVTMGSQHMGIADFPSCKAGDLLCHLTEAALRSGIYTEYAQTHVITAQYYRNPLALTSYHRYLKSNHFLADINNEVPGEEKAVYKKRLEALDAFVMVQFDEDTTVVPKRSSWFESYPLANDSSSSGRSSTFPGGPDMETIPLRQSEIYLEDRIGLKTLDKRGSLIMELCKGVHMQITPACQQKVFGNYIGSPHSLFFSSLFPPKVRHAWYRLLYLVAGVRGATVWPWPAHLLVILLGLTLIRLGATAGFWLGGKVRDEWEERRARKEGSIRLP